MKNKHWSKFTQNYENSSPFGDCSIVDAKEISTLDDEQDFEFTLALFSKMKNMKVSDKMDLKITIVEKVESILGVEA